MTRRQFAGAAIGSSGLAAAGIAYQHSAAEPRRVAAYDPWSRWEEGTGLVRTARAAILAANPHNTQPWQFRMEGNRLELFGDLRRRLGAIDPLLREFYISAGCALENLITSAAALGLGVKALNYDQNQSANRIVSIEFEVRPAQRSALYLAIPHRHTNRGPYRANCAIPNPLFRELERLNVDRDVIHVQLWSEPATWARMKDLIVAAAEATTADDEQSADSARWYRSTRKEIERYRDGITLDALGLSPAMTALAKMLPAPSRATADRFFVSSTRDVYCGPGATFGTILIKAKSDKELLARAGRLWQRMHLWATVNGIAMQPINQIHERIDREQTSAIDAEFTRDFAAFLHEPSWSGVFSFRMGYATRVANPSPRRDLAQFML